MKKKVEKMATVHVPEILHRRVKAYCERAGRKVGALAASLLERYLEAEKNNRKGIEE